MSLRSVEPCVWCGSDRMVPGTSWRTTDDGHSACGDACEAAWCKASSPQDVHARIAEAAEWKKAVEDANRISQRFEAENVRLRLALAPEPEAPRCASCKGTGLRGFGVPGVGPCPDCYGIGSPPAPAGGTGGREQGYQAGVLAAIRAVHAAGKAIDSRTAITADEMEKIMRTALDAACGGTGQRREGGET